MWRWKNPYHKAICLLFILLIVSGCSKSPESVVSQYLDYTFLDSDGEKAYELLSSDDHKYIDKVQFCEELSRKNVLSKKAMEKYEEYFRYEIVSENTVGDTSVIQVKITRPNAFYVLSDLVSYAMVTAFGNLSEVERSKAIAQKFDAIMMSKDRLLVSEDKYFKVIKEGSGYKLFLNVGLPQKQHQLSLKAEALERKGDEQEKKMNVDNALSFFKEALKFNYAKGLIKKTERLEKFKSNMALPGEKKVIGNIRFQPSVLEVRNSTSKRKGERKQVLSLTFTVENISEGQVFNLVENNSCKIENHLIDNFGNTMSEVVITSDSSSEGCLRLLPGNVAKVQLYSEGPLTSLADKFLWKIKLNTSNQGNTEYAYVSFTRKDISYIEN